MTAAHSERDDLESLAYVLSYLKKGYLPWDQDLDLGSDSGSERHLWQLKMITPASTLFTGMDGVYLEFWKELKGLAHGETPNYKKMIERFKARWIEKGLNAQRPGEIDWWEVWEMINKKGGRHQ